MGIPKPQTRVCAALATAVLVVSAAQVRGQSAVHVAPNAPADRPHGATSDTTMAVASGGMNPLGLLLFLVVAGLMFGVLTSRGPAPARTWMGVTVRRAEPGDAPGLARLRWQFRPEDWTGQSLDQFSREFEEWLIAALASDWMAAVADEGNGTLVGCIFLRSVSKVPNPGARDRAWGYVTNSYVAGTHRGRGVGGRLLGEVIAAARERGHEFLIVWPSEEALSLYARAGFREVGDVHGGPDDCPPLELVL